MSEALVMAGRGLTLSARKPGVLITGTRYISYVVPGMLLLAAFISTAATAVTVCQDMSGGIVDRFRSLDVSGTALLTGHVLASTARYAISAAAMVAIGFRPHATVAGALGAAGLAARFRGASAGHPGY